jgi:Carboxypeptidase regulatory-like domain/TonB dependent receptor
MTLTKALSCLLLLCAAAFGQSDRGTVTGTVADPGGAVVPNATVLLKNVETGTEYNTVATSTGNFTLASVPAGSYELTVSAPGFATYVQRGIQVQVALTVRLDVGLKIGGATESVTVTAEAAMLRTENAEASTNVSGDKINNLPLNFGGGAGAIGAIRNQMAFVVLSPGVAGSGTGARINGFAGNTFRVTIEGQDTTSGNTQARVDETQASVEAIEEFTLQTSNFAAEYGQALGGVFNFTIRSGTNHYHGTGFEYFTNEALNAKTPFGHIRPVSRKHDLGGTIGGPVRIPKLYNGKDKTFFFFNWEVFRNKVVGNSSTSLVTVPTDAFRNGDFSAALTGVRLGTDGLGRAIMENAIYDPKSDFTVNGATYRNLFPGNIIPAAQMDPVALKIQAFFPKATSGNLINNWLPAGIYTKTQSAPAVKIDHNFDEKDKLSFYYGYLSTNQKSGFDSLPVPITATRFQEIYSHTTRLNFDRSVTPTLLVHLGSGFIRYLNPDSANPGVLNYDAVTGIGFVGSANGLGFPRITGLSNGNFGGMSLGIGPANANHYYNDKWTSVASASYIRGNHSFKYGAEMRVDIFTDRNLRGAQGVLTFSGAQTGLPAISQTGQTLPGGTGVGLGYASFLLGDISSATVNAVQDPQWRKTSWAMYLQDTWKITRKLTLDYGIRWDYEEAGHEIWHRASTLGFNTPNPSIGGLPGALIFEGSGAGRCNCNLAGKYPYAIGPRLGAAYQITPKTVLRLGWGITYGNLPGLNYITNSTWYGVGFDAVSFDTPTPGEPAATLAGGLHYDVASLYKASLNPGLLPTPGQLNAPPVIIDRSWGRPPKINQYTASLQREVMRDLTVEAAFVGNRGVWEDAGGLQSPNVISDARLASFGLSLANSTDRALLTQSIVAPAVVARGFKLPYPTFPTGASLAQALRPYPQFSGGLTARDAALGNSWYDSLQTKVTKRYSHGLDLTAAFTWQKELTRTGSYNDPTKSRNQKRLAGGSTPLVFVTGFNYELQKHGGNNRLLNLATGGWIVGGLLRYTSGAVLGIPGSANGINNQIFRGGTVQNRVPGQPLFLKDIGCGCVDPNKDLVLNPAAWVDVPQGQWGNSAAAYNDFRGFRTADEQMSFGRNFHIREGKVLSIRAEFFNLFNRTILPDPGVGSPSATVTRDKNGNLTGGFGFVNANNAGQPRNGQLVARFQW